ncbi:MAG: fatty acid desaturase family protein [Myxococcota bacterium]
MHTGSLPKHDVMGPVTRAVEAGSIAAAAALVLVDGARLASWGDVGGAWLPLVAIAGALGADFASGLVHWAADTWGSESLPVLGRRLLRPFRVHHVNPDDFLERDFIDCNGDVALLASPLLVAAWLIPLENEWARIASAFLVVFAAVSLPTNQVHQWAHMPRPPRAVAWLQRRGWILSRAEHGRHHRAPHTSRYCIATGWCNAALDAIGFFPALERAISAVTGLRPRGDSP